MNRDHLIVREKGVLCTRCLVTEPVHQGHGTPMGTLIAAFDLLAARHQKCKDIVPRVGKKS
jgi:hypothetical protein